MRTFDFSPSHVTRSASDTCSTPIYLSHENQETYPPYDIVRKGEDAFQINLGIGRLLERRIRITSEASQLR